MKRSREKRQKKFKGFGEAALKIQWTEIRFVESCLCVKVATSRLNITKAGWQEIPCDNFTGYLGKGDKVKLPNLINAITLSLGGELRQKVNFMKLPAESQLQILGAVISATDPELLDFKIGDFVALKANYESRKKVV